MPPAEANRARLQVAARVPAPKAAKFVGQVQAYPPALLVQVAPSPQGEDAHSSISVHDFRSELISYPSLQTQVSVEADPEHSELATAEQAELAVQDMTASEEENTDCLQVRVRALPTSV